MSAASSSSSSSTISAARSGLSAASVSSACASSGHLGQRLAGELRRAAPAPPRARSSSSSAASTSARSAGSKSCARRTKTVISPLRTSSTMRSTRSLVGRHAGARQRGSPARWRRSGSAAARSGWGRPGRTSNSRPRTREPLAGVGNPAGPLDEQARRRWWTGPRAARRRSAPRCASGGTLPSVSKMAGPPGGSAADLLVMLVEDLADQLLEQVLQRRDAERAAELVEHDARGGGARAACRAAGRRSSGWRA